MASSVDAAPSSVGPGIIRAQHALDDQFTLPVAANSAKVLPDQMPPVREIPKHVFGQYRRAPRRVVVREMRHTMARNRLEESPEEPLRPRDSMPRQPGRGPKRRCEAGSGVVLPIRRDGGVDRNNQGLNPGRSNAVKKRLDLPHVSGQIGPKPGPGIHRGHFFQANQRRSAHDHRNIVLGSSLGHHDVPAVGKERAQSQGRDSERRCVGLAKQGRAGRPLRDVHQNPGDESVPVERTAVPSIERQALAGTPLRLPRSRPGIGSATCLRRPAARQRSPWPSHGGCDCRSG